MSFIVKEDLYNSVHDDSGMFNDISDWLVALQYIDNAPEVKVGSANVHEAELSYVYLFEDEAKRTNFALTCTYCGKIFECKSRRDAELLLASFKHCFDCGAEFVKEDTNERVSQD